MISSSLLRFKNYHQSFANPAPPRAGFFIAAGNTPSSHPPAMTLDTQMTLALLQELLLALRANDADGFKGWLALGLDELGELSAARDLTALRQQLIKEEADASA